MLPSREVPDFGDMVRAGQGTLQNMDALLKRLDRIVAFVESGQGSVGKLLYDPTLYNRLNATVNEFQGLVNQVAQGKGTLGKLFSDEELYNKANATVDKLNVVIDDLNAGKGSAGKFLKDPALYDNANATIANVKKLTDDINAGKGPIGMLAKDEEFARKLQNTMDKLSAISDRLEAGEGSAGKLLRDPSLYNNADQMLVETRGLVKNPRESQEVSDHPLQSFLMWARASRSCSISKCFSGASQSGMPASKRTSGTLAPTRIWWIPLVRGRGSWNAPAVRTRRGGSRSAALLLSDRRIHPACRSGK